MTTGKDIASFFENGTTEQFDYCYKIYPKVLQLKAEKRNKKPQELVRLDQWYQNELPKLIKARGKDAHLIYDELVQTMKWKQSRGKSYPQLNYLVKVNTPRAVMQETKKAFRKLPNLEQAITALSNLKGVGTTMASALLAAASPDSAPFMADECLMAIPEIEGIDYTTKEYLNFVQHIQNTVQRLNTQAGGDKPLWSPHRVELALWSHYVANELNPEMLEDMPGPGSGGHAANNTNGSANAKPKTEIKAADGGGGGGEDTNDGDEESLGAPAGEVDVAHKATNNTVSAVNAGGSLAQDGDSNFISNDSTSQEPIIDENTTQTTATTSTDECEVGTTTPLASDSESNIEAPRALAKNGGNMLATVTATAAAATPTTVVAAANSTSIDDATTLTLPPNETSNNSNSTITTTTTTTTNNNNNNNNNNSSSESTKLHSTSMVDGESECGDVVGAASTTSEDTPMTAVTAAAETTTTAAAAAVSSVGNGNGTLLANSSSLGGADSMDGENSSCIRSSANEGASEYDDDEDDDDEDDEDDDRNADESSNSNSRNVAVSGGGGGVGVVDGGVNSLKTVAPIITVNDASNANTINNVDNDTTITIGQKRTALQCINDVGDGDGIDGGNIDSSSEAKKSRRD